MQHLRAADAVDEAHPGLLVELVPPSLGRCSPAEIGPAQAAPARPALPARSMALYAVGEVNSTVAPELRDGVGAAPAGWPFPAAGWPRRRACGKTSRPPSAEREAQWRRPGEHIRPARPCTRYLPKVSAIASTSRWKCMVALGTPVVPDVAASMATSSAAVSTSSNVLGLAAHRSARSSWPAPPYWISGRSGAALASSLGEPVVDSSRAGRVSSVSGPSSTLRSIGMVVTTTPPGLQHAEPAGDQPGVVRARGAARAGRAPGRSPR